MTEEQKIEALQRILQGANVAQVNLGNGYQTFNIGKDGNWQQEPTADAQVVDAEVVEDADAIDHFPLLFTTDKLISFRDSLVVHNFIGQDTTNEEFLYYFGHVEYKPDTLAHITWIPNKSNKQLLRELIMGMYKPMIDLKEVTKANLEKIVPSVFVNTKGEPILLAKEKKVPSWESDKIEEFLATLHK